MSVYGDLDISVIDELPPGRKQIKTALRYDKDRLSVFKFMKEEISYLVNDILSSFSFGPNFLSDLEKLKKHEHCMLSIAILSRFIGKSLNEIFDKYFTIIDKEMITTLSTEIESVFP